jgi:hypothetical protein
MNSPDRPRGDDAGFVPVHRARPICRWCHRRPALARVGGAWRVVKHHDVCRQCWRAYLDSCAAAKLAA